MSTHVIVKLDLPIEEKYWEDDDVFSNEYYGIGKPLILCKDCTHKEDCQWYYYSGDDYGFCKWAERKEE